DPRLDVPPRTRLDRRYRERVDPRISDVPIRPRASPHGDAGADRRSADHPLRDRRAVQRHRAGLYGPGHRHDPGVLLGAVARDLPRRQGVQAVSDPRGYGTEPLKRYATRAKQESPISRWRHDMRMMLMVKGDPEPGA